MEDFNTDSEVRLFGPNVHGVYIEQIVTIGSEEFKNMIVRCRALGMNCHATIGNTIVCQVDKGFLVHPLLDVKMNSEPYVGQISLGVLVRCMYFKMTAENKKILFASDNNIPVSVSVVVTDDGPQTLVNYNIIEQTDKDIHIEYDSFGNDGEVDGERIKTWFYGVL